MFCSHDRGVCAVAEDLALNSPVTILVVEDDPLIRALAAEHLQEHGYRVIEATTADEAMSWLSRDVNVDLVFSDVSLPGARGGLQLGVWLHNHYPAISLLLTSGVPPMVSILGEERAAPFIAKPYDLNELVRRVDQLVKLHARRRAS